MPAAKWRFRADDGQRNVFLLREIGQRLRIGDRDVFQAIVECRAAVARRDIDHLNPFGLRQFPGEGVFAAA
jgi:hypothetical protein